MPQLLAIPLIAGVAGAGATGLSGMLAGSALGSTALGGAAASGLGAAGAGLTGLSSAAAAPFASLLGGATASATGATSVAGGAAADIAAAGTQAQGAAAAGGLGTPSTGVTTGGIGQLGITSEGGASRLLTLEQALGMADPVTGEAAIISDAYGDRYALPGVVGQSTEMTGGVDLAKTGSSGLLEQLGITTSKGAGSDIAVDGGIGKNWMDGALSNALEIGSMMGGGDPQPVAPAQAAQIQQIGGGQAGGGASLEEILNRVLRGY